MMELFLCQRLSLLDLCSVAETCQRFRRILHRTVPKSFLFVANDDGWWKVETQNYPARTYTSAETRRILETFGPTLTAITFFNFSDDNCKFFVDWLCDSRNIDNLKKLTIHQSSISEKPLSYVKLKPIFQTLEMLYLDSNLMVVPSKSLFSGMDELVHLKLAIVERWDAVLANTFPKLRRFECHSFNLTVETLEFRTNRKACQSLDVLTDFLSRHTALTALHLRFHADVTCRTKIFQAVGNNCKKLEELAVSCGVGTTADHLAPMLASLRYLKTVELRHMALEDFDFLLVLTKLADLRLYNCTLPTSNRFAALNHLTRLEIADYFREFDLIGVVRHLTNIDEICLITQKILNEETYLQILDALRRRSSTLTIKCEANFYLKKSQLYQNVKLLPPPPLYF